MQAQQNVAGGAGGTNQINTGQFNASSFVTSVRVEEREKKRLMNLHDEFKQLIDVGLSDEEEDSEEKERKKDEYEETKGGLGRLIDQSSIMNDSRMVVDSTALPSDNGNTTSTKAMNPSVQDAVIKKGSHRFQVQVSEKDIEKIKEECQSNNLPLIEEFDFRKDNKTPDLRIELKSTTQVRDY